MKKIFNILIPLLLLTACEQSQRSKPANTPQKAATQNDKTAVNQNKESKASVSTSSSQNQSSSSQNNEPGKAVTKPVSPSFYSYAGDYRDGQGTGFNLLFLDGKVGRKAIINNLTTVYNNGGFLVMDMRDNVTFAENGKASFRYANKRRGRND